MAAPLLLVALLAATAAAATAADEAPGPPDIDWSLAPPAEFAVWSVEDPAGAVLLQWVPMPQASAYIIYREYAGDAEGTPGAVRLEEAVATLVRWGRIDPVPGADRMRVIVAGPGQRFGVWAVSAVVDSPQGAAQTPLSWARLEAVPTAVAPWGWAALKAAVR